MEMLHSFVTLLCRLYILSSLEGAIMAYERLVSQLAQAYADVSRLYFTQSPQTCDFIDSQVVAVAAALDRKGKAIRFQLPDRILLEGGEALVLPLSTRRRSIPGGPRRRERLVRHLHRLEHSINPALAACGSMMRFALARHLLKRLPDGHDTGCAAEGHATSTCLPLTEARLDALLVTNRMAAGVQVNDAGGSFVQIQCAPPEQVFYLPQWAAFDCEDRMLVASLAEAEACIASLQQAADILEQVPSICPSIVADEDYQRKRAGLLGQLVEQGRALARAYARKIVDKILLRIQNGTLNRGLELSLPYFDDEDLSMHTYPVEVIPGGRVMFVPAFVVRAMQLTEVQIQRNTRLGSSTRQHLLTQLTSIENAFSGHSSR
jgi:hypothetical protein